jgi:hypothetical protein
MATANSSSPEATSLTISGSELGTPLYKLLMADNIEPGSEPSYQLCKLIFLFHPLGGKMAEAPIKSAQSQQRTFTVQNAPDEVVKKLIEEHKKLKTNENILNVGSICRAYGAASIALNVDGKPSDEILDFETLYKESISFNVLDPLNTAGSLVLNQSPTAMDFEKPTFLRTNNQTYHRSRYVVIMNGSPVYIAYTQSAFGYVGRSVYQRALFPLKSFIRSMIADDMIELKLGLIIAKMKAPGSVINKAMAKILAFKRAILREAQTGNVVSIDPEEEIETLNMQNVEGAGTFSRGNILKNIATSADMPAVMLENETLTEGFGEGTEDAKNIARYINSIREWLEPLYQWFDNIAMYRAWNVEFFQVMQQQHPDKYAGKDYQATFMEWRAAYTAAWPSWLIEPESEEVEVEKTKFEAIISVFEALYEILDPTNQMKLLQWVADNISESKKIFEHELALDYDEMKEHLEEQKQRLQDQEDAQAEALRNGTMIGNEDADEEGGGKPNGKTPPKDGSDKGAGKGVKPKPKALPKLQ